MPYIDLGRVVGETGPQGATGPRGATGATGPAGPSQVTASTSTTLNGILKGNGSQISAQQPDASPVANSANLVTSGGVYDALSNIPNQNMIPNWYFFGGGSGRGVMPVNQRGKTSYTSSGMTIDGWLANSNVDVIVNSNRLTLDATNYASTGYIRFYLGERPSGYITFSALVRSSSGTGTLGQLGVQRRDLSAISDTSARASIADLDNTWTLVTGTYNATYTDDVSVVSLSVLAGRSYDVLAVKLERGQTQTLAHASGSGWVLNETPDYDLALMQCQLNRGVSNDTFANHFIATAEMLGPVEVGTTASRAYTTGKIFVWNGLLYKAKTSIASGATLTVGTNCEQTTLAALLNM